MFIPAISVVISETIFEHFPKGSNINVGHDKTFINVREYRRSNKKWIIQRNWQHRLYMTKTITTKTQHNMCWTLLYANKHKYRK